MTDRDPKIDPQPGDEIQQPSGLLIVVTSVDGDNVSWRERSAKGRYIADNSWSLRAWREVVAKGAKVIDVYVPECNS